MAYTKTTWAEGSAPGISAENLNKLETQYDEVKAELGNNAGELWAQIKAADGPGSGLSADKLKDYDHRGVGGEAEHPVATTTTAGFMSASDKSKLDGIIAGATHGAAGVYVHSDGNTYNNGDVVIITIPIGISVTVGRVSAEGRAMFLGFCTTTASDAHAYTWDNHSSNNYYGGMFANAIDDTYLDQPVSSASYYLYNSYIRVQSIYISGTNLIIELKILADGITVPGKTWYWEVK